MTAEQYLRLATESVGMPTPPATSERLRAARTSMGERPCWDAAVDLGPISDAPWRSMVIVGHWADAPASYGNSRANRSPSPPRFSSSGSARSS
ncbi:hypothetical protein E1202_01670 [Saccharopolyspora karakumensis]|uniref:Uncharacterized protein n=1 Tax=Saccharopolyspora karakumensis TaxID=2530386 RepID=A0A4R5C2F7_9PSEU|nr:hypothetical protein [Saccharopolyspora karakumensis]TDD92719.1 hypothetical protein E1202_01670 [Saccharopolyspora karakumensis]